MKRKLFKHYSEVPKHWYRSKYYPLSHERMHSRDDGSFQYDERTLRFIDTLVDNLGSKPTLNSVYRSPVLNARVGGARLSRHVQGIAVDLGFKYAKEVDPMLLVVAGKAAGAKGIGLYKTFVHFDLREGKTGFWIQNGALDFWKSNAIYKREHLGL